MLRALMSSLLKNLLVRPLQVAAKVIGTGHPTEITYEEADGVITLANEDGGTSTHRPIYFHDEESYGFRN